MGVASVFRANWASCMDFFFFFFFWGGGGGGGSQPLLLMSWAFFFFSFFFLLLCKESGQVINCVIKIPNPALILTV